MTKQIGIIVTTGKDAGIGHLMRMKNLSFYLDTIQKDSFVFLYHDNYEHEVFNKFNITNIDSINNINKFQTIIVDNYEYDLNKLNNKNILVMDDYNHRKHYNNQIVINAFHDINLFSEQYLQKGAEQLWLGGEYSIIKPDVFKQKDNVPNINNIYLNKNNIKNILIMIGGSDPLNMRHDLFNVIKKQNVFDIKNTTFHYVIGPNAEPVNSDLDFIKTYHNPDNLIDLMMQADLVISAGGQTLLELYLLKKPTMAFIVADNQRSWLTSEHALFPCFIDLTTDNWQSDFFKNIDQNLNQNFEFNSKYDYGINIAQNIINILNK